MVQLEKDLAQFEQAQAQVIAVAVQDQNAAKTLVQETGITYPVLADSNHAVAEAYGVFNLLNDNVAAPSVFIINKAGGLVWSQIGQAINDRPTNQTILVNIPAE